MSILDGGPTESECNLESLSLVLFYVVAKYNLKRHQHKVLESATRDVDARCMTIAKELQLHYEPCATDVDSLFGTVMYTLYHVG
jgi:hypothetical protein